MARSRPHQTPTEMLDFFTNETRRVYRRLAPRLRRAGLMDDRSGLGVVYLCAQAAQLAVLVGARRRWPGDQAIRVALERARLAAREGAADFELLPARRVRVAALDPQGEDLDLIKIFGESA